ncbi:MAG: hypothetical protein Q7R64_00755 [bacterium]|nr:hypothetical protein [bacterium]
MKIVLQIAKTIVGWLLAGLNELKVSATPALLKYLELIEKLAIKGIAGPLVLGALAFLGFGITTLSVDILQYWGWTGRFWSWVALLLGKTGVLWTAMLAIAGIVSFMYMWLCGVLAAPIGVLVHAASPTPRSTPSAPVTISFGELTGSILTEIRDARIGLTNALQVGVKEYVSQVKFVLTFVGLTYFFAAIFPSLRGTVLLFILGALILTAMREFKHPVASFLRFAVCVALLWCVAGRMFPVLNPFAHYFGTSPEKLTMTEIEGTTRSTWDFVNVFIPANWTKPAFWLLLIVVAPFVYVAYTTVLGLAKTASARATTAVGGADHHGATSPTHDTSHGSGHGGGSGRLMQAGIIALIALVLVVIGTKVLDFHERHGARIGAEEELRRIRLLAEEAQTRTSAPRPGNGSTAVRTPTETINMVTPSLMATAKQGLKNAKGYVLNVSSETFSPGVPLPSDMSFRIEPEGFPTVIQVNGEYIWERTPGVLNIVPNDARFLCVKAKNASTYTNIIMWVGKES